jgi:hypothetical protein
MSTGDYSCSSNVAESTCTTLGLALEANTTYYFKYRPVFRSAATGTGIWFGIECSNNSSIVKIAYAKIIPATNVVAGHMSSAL